MEEIYLNLIPAGTHPVCHAKQYDEGRTIKANIFEGAMAYTFQEGDSLVINVLKPNGDNVTTNVDVNVGEAYAYIVTTEEMCNIVGKNECELRLKNGAKNIGTLNFFMDVEEAIAEAEPVPPVKPQSTNFKVSEINYEMEITII